ncbi:putative calcium-transporting ATPase 13, plasma membrane-type [Impatiens glandulifera]|uniref:putative calcium-transporting ATPase 13, plasma membrane-type n=1 Tax=Impatiens glandulifera TaxID=253017 RepID=UPI001FB0EA85|nr:putative calcium-transporting ATPase 13, plasma membrane-type [Impatiens glandulifera]
MLPPDHEKCHLIEPPYKRLRKAFRVTYFIVSLSNTARRAAAAARVLPVSVDAEYPLHVALDISMEIDRKALSLLVPERNMEALAMFGGGVESLAVALQSDTKLGISSGDVKRRVEMFGSNTYVKPPVRSFFSFVVEAFKDITIIILLACAILSLGFGIKQHGIKEGWYDGGSIIVAVVLVIAVSAVSNYRQGTQFHKLSEESEDINVQVLRDGGRRQPISVFDIVVGDVIFLNIGDRVPADGLFLDGHSMRVDESSMNGESDHVEVDATNPFLLSGTKVADGYGHMMVTSVGMNTSWGEMMSSINRDSNELTPLQERLTKLTSYIGKIGLLVAFVVLAVLMIRYFTGHTNDDQGRREFTKGVTKSDDIMNAMIRIVAAAVTIIVVAIPEGLPLAVTLTLAYSMRRMMGDNAMVRKLSACETMGSATTICTDKTGTLTLNQMKVTEAWMGKVLLTDNFPQEVLQLLHEGIALNTTGEVYNKKEISGSPTESAILHWAVFDLGADIEELKKRHEIVHVEAFNSKKKRSGVLIRRNERVEAHWKGAAEMILDMCTNYYDQNGVTKSMKNEDRMQINGIIDDMAAKSLRCIAFAHKEIGRVTEEGIEETGLTLLAIVGIKDPCRPGVKEAVLSCKHAGVDVKMITGDNKFTATAIALECGILRVNEDLTNAVVEGSTFRNYTNEERMEKIDMIRVMARSSPMDKLLMVECLKRKGQVVAVTGDGTNDAPALKEADIGLSMGIQGTEVAKESSDIVIMDDNFTSVVTVLKWGRCVYNNIQKFIQFQLTVNVAALVINVVAALSSGEVPLTAVQLLWVNLIMDTLGALALATEQPTDDLLTKKPVGRTEPLITKVMWRNLTAQALYQITVLLVLEFKGRDIFGVNEKVKDTLVFNSFVLCQVFNEFNARNLEKKNIFNGILKNRLFIGIIVVTLVLQALMVEFLKKFASTERLDWGQWCVCILIGSLSWPIAWIVKFIPVSRKGVLLSLPTIRTMET